MKCCEYFYSEDLAKEYIKTLWWIDANPELIETQEPDDDGEGTTREDGKIWLVYFNPKPMY